MTTQALAHTAYTPLAQASVHDSSRSVATTRGLSDGTRAYAAMAACGSCVLFSAWMEGKSYDKLLDVQNRCAEPVSLSEWELKNCGNGCTDWEHTLSLGSATLPPLGVRIDMHSHVDNLTPRFVGGGNDFEALAKTARVKPVLNQCQMPVVPPSPLCGTGYSKRFRVRRVYPSLAAAAGQS